MNSPSAGLRHRRRQQCSEFRACARKAFYQIQFPVPQWTTCRVSRTADVHSEQSSFLIWFLTASLLKAAGGGAGAVLSENNEFFLTDYNAPTVFLPLNLRSLS